jgi:hypothetical protein
MLFPHSYAAVLLVALASLILGALWALLMKAAGKWRFELFGIDFGFGVILSALAVCFTLGTLGEDITFYDNLMIMRKSSLGLLIGFGAILNLGMLLLIGAASVAGLTVAFLPGLGIAVITAAIGMHVTQPLMSPVFLGIGSALLLGAIAIAASAYTARVRQRDTDLLQKAVAAGIKGKIQRTSPTKGLLLAIIGGLLTGLAQPVALWAQGRDEIGFGAYSMGALFAAAFVAGTPFFSLFFLNLPVQGEALSFGDWFRSKPKQHLLGLAAGFIWFAGLTAMLLAATATPAAGVGRALAFAVSRGFILVGAAAGIFLHKDFGNFAPARKQAIIALGVAAAGLAVYAAGKS